MNERLGLHIQGAGFIIYPKECFDEAGILTEKIEIYSSFLKFAPKDFDGDGFFEIECIQVLYFDWHRNFAGYARVVMKFNKETQQFDVVQSKYLAQGI